MAMEQETERASTTALGVLSAVIVGGTEHDAKVRVEDSFAPRLLRWRDGKFWLARVRALHPLLRRVMEYELPGAYGFIIARIHHMDAVIRRELAAGLDRIVILGAGYDTRAHRMRESLDGVPVLELDHPATSREKRTRLDKALGSEPSGITYVDVDFTHQNLLERLADHGHELSMRTLFVLSGVTYYLPEEAVFELFDQVASHASPRTSLLFDYAFEDVYTDPERYHGGSAFVPWTTDYGEEPRSGFRAGEIGAILADHGLRLDSHIDPGELETRYLRRADGTSAARPSGYIAIAHGFVGSSGADEQPVRAGGDRCESSGSLRSRLRRHA